MGIMEKIREIEAEIGRTQKNKATNYHIGLLKAKLSKLRSELLDGSKSGKGGGEGFDVMKSGDARVALIGFPSVGKSTLLSTLTNTKSEAAAYEFTTLTCMAEDTEVLTDRGFMTRAEVFAACPVLAPSSPTAAPASDNVVLPFGGAVFSRRVNPLYWTPSAVEEKADEAAGIRHEQLSSTSAAAVQLRDAAGQYGRQCGLCSRRVWSVSARGAGTQMYQHNISAHPAEMAAASRTGGQASITSAAPASSTSRLSSSPSSSSPSRPPLARPASMPVGQVSAAGPAHPASPSPPAHRPSTASTASFDAAARRPSTSLSSSSSDSANSAAASAARPLLVRPASLPAGVRTSVDKTEQAALRHATLHGGGAVRRGSLQFKNPSAMSDVSVEQSPAPASAGRSSSSGVYADIQRPTTPFTCEWCGSDEVDWDDDVELFHCSDCWEYASDEWVAQWQDDEDEPVADEMDVELAIGADRPAPAATSSSLLFASLDPSTGHLVYLPATAITYKLVSSLVEFTHAAEAPSWKEDADVYGLTPDEQRRMKERSDRARAGEVLEEEDKHRVEHLSNGVSLLVDRQHDMYVRVGLQKSNAAGDQRHIIWADDYVKVKAGSLVSDSSRQRVRMTGQATAGFDASAVSDEQLPFIAALRLSSTAEIDTFLWLYGYWCGDGYLAAQSGHRAVGFTLKKDTDKKEVKKRLEALGFTVPSASVHVYDNADGGRTFEVTDGRWVDYFFGEYGPKYGVASVSSSRPHTHTGLTTPLPTSVKWFWVWVWRLRKARARLVLAGLRYADGQEAADRKVIYTSGVRFRDDIVRLALHAGYSARCDVHYKKGDHRGFRDNGEEIVAQHDGWKVAYSDSPQAAEPILHNYRDVKVLEAPSAAHVPVWCVTVPPHHLIIARRVRENGNVVTQASKPIVVGNCIPGVIEYKDATIQLLDLPGIIEGASKGKGRGRQVIAVARTADLVLMMLDASKAELQQELLTRELYSVGIRINARRPDINIRIKKTGGVSLNAMVELHHIDLHLVRNILHLYRIFNADVLCRQDVTADELIDVVEGNRVYLRALFVCNKIDTVYLDDVDFLAHYPHHVVISCNERLNLDFLLEKVWQYLDFIRVYTKPRGRRPDFTEPIIMRNGARLDDLCHCIHRDMVKNFKYGLVWGTSAKHQPQRVGIVHELQDEDVVQVMTK